MFADLLFNKPIQLPKGSVRIISYESQADRKMKYAHNTAALLHSEDRVFEAIAAGCELRKEITSHTGISLTTVGKAIAALLAAGRIQRTIRREAHYHTVAGRKPTFKSAPLPPGERPNLRREECLQEAIAALRKLGGEAKMQDLVYQLPVTETAIRDRMRLLVERELVIREGTGRAGRYILQEAV